MSALLFDFGGTLDAEGVSWKERFFRIWREEAGDVPRETFDPAFYAADDALVGAVEPSSTLTETVERLARGVAHRLAGGEGRGRDGEAADRTAARFSGETLGTLASRGPLLARLARRYRLGIVSNFYGNLAGACAEAGISESFGALVDSFDVGCVKPEPAIFRAALDKLGVRPSEAVFVGDSIERDMAGARALGMRHVLIRPAGGPDPFLCCPDDRVIRRLEEVEGELP